jgi:general stress protein YciG
MTHEDDTMTMQHTGQESVNEGEMNPRPNESAPEAPAPRKKARRGFAAMSPEKQREIASLGGKAAHAKGTAHEFSPEEAREAGRKGGQAAQRARAATPPSTTQQDEEPTKH